MMYLIFVIVFLWIFHFLDDEDRRSLATLGEHLLLALARLARRLLNYLLNVCLLVVCYQYWSPYLNLPWRPDYDHLSRLLLSSSHFSLDPNFKFSFLGFLPSTTPFLTAIQRSTDGAFLHRLLRAGASLTILSDDGETPAHLAASAGCLNGLNFSLDHGVDPNAEDSRGLTPIMSAVLKAPLPCLAGTLKTLTESGADPRRKTPQGRTILHLVVSRLEPNLLSLDRALEVLDFAFRGGVSTGDKDAEGLTAAEMARGLERGLLDAARRIVETDSRYGLDSRPFLDRFSSKLDLVLSQLETETVGVAVKKRNDRPIEGEKIGQSECSICLENQSNTALDPCGHCVCHQCSNELSVCPYCRTLVNKTLRIYR